MYAPVPLVPVDSSILSSYGKSGTGGPRNELRGLSTYAWGCCVAEVGVALKKLNDACLIAGADFRVTELHRDVGTQALARAKYERWVAAGKPTGAAFNAKTMKAAYVAMPGRSGHNAGRSIDIDTGKLVFPGVASNLQLDKLWEIAIPLGWKPVIKEAKEGASESWHLDYPGELSGVMARDGYEQWAVCGALLVGHSDFDDFDAVVQACLCRAGFSIGKIDGDPGKMTNAALEAAVPGGVKRMTARDESLFAELLAVPAK